MIPVTVHYRGFGSEPRNVAAVPVVGCYLFGLGTERRLWQVSAVVVGSVVEVFALEVSPQLAGELTAAWAAWGEVVSTTVDKAHPTERLPGRAGRDRLLTGGEK